MIIILERDEIRDTRGGQRAMSGAIVILYTIAFAVFTIGGILQG